MKKILVIGPQLSGKTTLVNYLRENSQSLISEVDEEIVKSNGGSWPQDNTHKDTVIIPSIYENVSKLEDVIFFANHFEPTTLLHKFKENDFKIILLEISHKELIKRNNYRVKNEGYDDATPWIKGQLENHAKLKTLDLIDLVVDATKSTDEIADIILNR